MVSEDGVRYRVDEPPASLHGRGCGQVLDTRDRPVYTWGMTTARAKLFRNGGSQAVRLPKTCAFPSNQSEVLIRRDGRRIILEPVDTWSEEFLACLGGLESDDDIPRIKQVPVAKMKNPFA